MGAKGFELRSSRADTNKRRHVVSSNKLSHIGSTPTKFELALREDKNDKRALCALFFLELGSELAHEGKLLKNKKVTLSSGLSF